MIFCSGLELKKIKLLYQNIKEFFQTLEEVAIMLGFGSKQPLQQQSLSALLVFMCTVMAYSVV